jgi:hypothetical protein
VLEKVSKDQEAPRDEMQRLIRRIAGSRHAGEKDFQLMDRAARLMGISSSRAKVFWYAATDNIRSEEMDRARDLAAVQPIREAKDAIQQALGELRDLLRDGNRVLAHGPLADGVDHPRRRRGDLPSHPPSLASGRPRKRRSMVSAA